jgi:class 3 adenylate cyclase
LFVGCTLFIQDAKSQNLDSLYFDWQNTSLPDSNRIKALDDYIWFGFVSSNPNQAIALCDSLYEFAEIRGNKKVMATAMNMKGIAYDNISDFPNALKYHQKSLSLREELGEKQGMGASLNNIGIIYQNQGNQPKALDYYQRSLKIKEEIGDQKGTAITLNNIGIIYFNLEEYDEALDHHQRSLKIKQKIGDQSGISSSLGHIGNIYFILKDYPKALDYSGRSLKIQEAIGDQKGIAGTLYYLGNHYYKQGDYTQSLDYHIRSLQINEEIGYKLGMAKSLYSIGVNYNEQSRYAAAIAQCKKSLTLSVDMGALEIQQSACNCLYNAYKSKGETKEALAYYEQMNKVKDSIFSEENTKKFTRLEVKHEYDIKEAAAKLEQEKKDALAAQEIKRNKFIRNGFIVGFGVMLLFALIFFSQRNKIKAGKKQSDELLLNILPAEVAEELKAKGRTEAKQFEAATILFTDFKEFTAMSEKMTPKELVHDLNVCFSEFDKITSKYETEKIKTIGDAYMAACGVPTPTTDHAQKAVLAALEMALFIEKGKQKKIALGLPYFEVRIGVHSGPLIAGIVGVKKFQYDIWGDTVNTASRMESSGEVGKVNISQATYDLIKDDESFEFQKRGKIEVKGKGEIEMYFVSKK